MNVLLITDGLAAAVAATILLSKAKDEYVIKVVMVFILEMGRTQCTLQTDGENVTKDIAATASKRLGDIPILKSPTYSSQGLGYAERQIQTLWAQARTMRAHLEDVYQIKMDVRHLLGAWMIRHAAWQVTRFL